MSEGMLTLTDITNSSNNDEGASRDALRRRAERYARAHDLAWPVQPFPPQTDFVPGIVPDFKDPRYNDDYREFQDRYAYHERNDIVKVAVLNDIHIPFQNQDALYGPVLSVLKEYQPDFITDGSDIFDFPHISKFPVTMGVEETLETSMDIYREWRSELVKTVPNHTSFFVGGNHDDRYRAYLLGNASYFARRNLEQFEEDIRSTGTLFFGWDQMMIDFGGILGIHHNKFTSKYPANQFYDKMAGFYMAIIGGHVHRTDMTARNGVWRGVPYTQRAYITGCLCQLIPHYSKSNDPEKWDLGFALATIKRSSWSVSVDMIRIEPTTTEAVWSGRVYN